MRKMQWEEREMGKERERGAGKERNKEDMEDIDKMEWKRGSLLKGRIKVEKKTCVLERRT